jgi:hypothetical protein
MHISKKITIIKNREQANIIKINKSFTKSLHKSNFFYCCTKQLNHEQKI